MGRVILWIALGLLGLLLIWIVVSSSPAELLDLRPRNGGGPGNAPSIL